MSKKDLDIEKMFKEDQAATEEFLKELYPYTLDKFVDLVRASEEGSRGLVRFGLALEGLMTLMLESIAEAIKGKTINGDVSTILSPVFYTLHKRLEHIEKELKQTTH